MSGSSDQGHGQSRKAIRLYFRGLKISDAFGMMKQVLQNSTADKILTCGVTGEIMLMAMGISLEVQGKIYKGQIS